MTGPRVRLAAAVLGCVVLGLSACSGASEPSDGATPVPTTAAATSSESPSPEDDGATQCADAATGIVDAVAALVATFETGGGRAATDESGTIDDVQDAVAASHSVSQLFGCDQQQMQDATEAGLGRLSPSDPVATAVLARVTNTLLGRAATGAADVTVAPGEDLHEVLARVAAGSTLTLPAGEISLAEPLVLLESVSLRGAGIDRTTLVSTAPGAAIIDVSGSALVIADLTVQVDAEASGIVTGPRAQLVLTAVRVTGARLDEHRAGGAGVHLVGSSGPDGVVGPSGEHASVEMTDCILEDNAWAGVVVGGDHRVSIEGATLRSNGEVGILFVESGGGSIAESTITDNPLGIGVTDAASPVLVDLTVTGGLVGVQLEGTSSATISALTVRDVEQAGVIVTAEAAGALTEVSCVDLEFGIVVADTAAPTLADVDCTVARGT